jgi:hypothetical protein
MISIGSRAVESKRFQMAPVNLGSSAHDLDWLGPITLRTRQ